jgi:hypothetical protein
MELAAALARTDDPRRYVVGQVTAVDVVAARITVSLQGGEVYLPAAGGAYSVNDLVLVGRSAGSWWILTEVGTAASPPATPDPVAPPDPDVYRLVSVAARSTHTYRGGWRTDTTDLYQGDWTGRGQNTGVAFYGSALVGLKADAGASGNRISVRVKRLEGGSYAAQAPTLWTVSQRVKPGGAPTRLASFAGPSLKPGQSGTVTLPDARAAELLDGSAGGIACYVAADTPYLQLAGRAAWSAAMSLAVRYAR